MEVEIRKMYPQARNVRESETGGGKKQLFAKDFGENMAISTP